MCETRLQISASVLMKIVPLRHIFLFTYGSEFRQFTVEIIQESFLCLPQQPTNLTSVSALNTSCY